MAKIIYSNEAIKNLKEIETYDRIEWGFEKARKVTESIMNVIDRLAVFPKSGSTAPSNRLNRQGYQKLVSGHYIVLYKYDENEEKVYIDYIYRETQNIN